MSEQQSVEKAHMEMCGSATLADGRVVPGCHIDTDPAAEKDVIAAVLADHVRGDWSDHTYSCHGCRKRFEEATQAAWVNGIDEERMAIREQLGQHIKPDWTLAEYHAHVAEHLVAALSNPPGQSPSDGDA